MAMTGAIGLRARVEGLELRAKVWGIELGARAGGIGLGTRLGLRARNAGEAGGSC